MNVLFHSEVWPKTKITTQDKNMEIRGRSVKYDLSFYNIRHGNFSPFKTRERLWKINDGKLWLRIGNNKNWLGQRKEKSPQPVELLCEAVLRCRNAVS